MTRLLDRPPTAAEQATGLAGHNCPACPVPLPAAVPCPTCERGCDCVGGIPGVGCEHYACWGRAATGTCPGVPVARAARVAALTGGAR